FRRLHSGITLLRMGGKRELNLLLRGARQELQETQEQTAVAIGELLGRPVDPEYIGRLERGVVTWPNAEYRAAFQQHFGVASPRELGFYCRRSQPQPVEADKVKRRVFISTLPLPLVASAGEPLARLVHLANSEPTDLPRRVGAEHVAQVRELVSQAYQLDHQWGGGQVREILGAQMRWAVGLLEAAVDPAVSDDLHSAVGWLAAQSGWSCHDVGANGAAQRYIEVAVRCAEQADDWDLRAYAYSDLSRILAYGGDGDMALTASQQSQIRSDRLTPLTRAFLASVEARAHAKRNDGQSAIAAVRRAEEHFTAIVPANETSENLLFLPPTKLAGDTGHALWPVAMRGQHVGTTLELLRSAADSYPSHKARARALCELRLASLMFAQGDPAEAITVATSALDHAGTLRSQRIRDNLT
ncbi:MAG: hypothetical protein LC808_19635, partial [Actinobacteria bacterium]|nr:hypothetical protein [Actinomycetota bacterium]